MIKLTAFIACGMSAWIASSATNKEPSGLVLLGPEVTKLDWNTRALNRADVDSDGLDDIVLINNDHARVEMLLQKGERADEPEQRRILRTNRWEPILEDTRFVKKHVATGTTMYALAVGDFNHDKRADFVYTSKLEGLTVIFQDEGGESWTEKEHFDELVPLPWAATLKVHDLNQDGLDDLIALGVGQMLIYIQDEEEGLLEPNKLWLGSESFYAIQVGDLNRDGLLDILYQAPSNERSLRARMQYPSGGFGPELSFGMNVSSGFIEPLVLPNAERQHYAFIDANTQSVDTVQFVASNTVDEEKQELFPQVYGTGNVSATSSYTLADFTDDGELDLIIGDAEEARVWFFEQTKSGMWQEGIDYPSLAGISALDTIQLQGNKYEPSVVLLSADENMVGISQFNEDKRLVFPKTLSFSGEPEAFAVRHVEAGEAGVEELLVVESRKRDFFLTWLKHDSAISGFETVSSVKLDGVKRAPRSVQFFDFDQDGQDELLLVLPREAARIYRLNDDSAWEEIAQDSGMRKSLLDDLVPAQIGYGDVNNDGRDELLIGGKGFIRALMLNSQNELVVVEQFNSRRGDDAVSIPMIIDVDDDGEKEVVFYVQELQELQVLEEDEQGVFRYHHAIDVGKIDAVACHPIYKTRRAPSTGKRAKPKFETYLSDLLIMGKEKFWMVPLNSEGLVVEAKHSYETDLEDVVYGQLRAGDLDDDGWDEILLIDGINHVIEILKYDSEFKDWKSAMHFVIFEKNMHYGGRQGAPLEPREILLGDFTGDGREDFVLLVHDRILLYPQGEPIR